MNKPVFLILLGGMFFGAGSLSHCSEATSSDTGISNLDTAQVATAHKIEIPGEVELPFGPKDSTDGEFCRHSDLFYQQMIPQTGKDTSNFSASFPLPPISSYDYLILDPDQYGSNTCLNGQPVGQFLEFDRYTKRLPDRGKLEVYYCSGQYEHAAYLNGEIEGSCSEFSFPVYGFLLLRNPLDSSSKVIRVYSEKFTDALVVRKFKIDSGYQLSICEVMYTDDDEGNGSIADYLPPMEFQLSKNGELIPLTQTP